MSDSARKLIDEAVRAHGGAALWDRLTGLRFTMRARGLLLATRGRSPLWCNYSFEISTREPRTVIFPFGAAAGRGVYAGDSVRIERLDGELLAERHDARAHARDHIFWDDLDLLYLLGYSFWSYHSLPFLLRRDDVHSVEIEPWRDLSTGQSLRRLRVQFPPGVPVHCPEQLLYFDERRLLMRLDYASEVFKPSRAGAQLCEDYRDCGGLMVASRRRAFPFARGARPMLLMPTLMEAFLHDIELLTG